MGEVIMFIPRSNPKADRAFWKGRPENDDGRLPDDGHLEFVGPISNRLADTAPSEMNPDVPA